MWKLCFAASILLFGCAKSLTAEEIVKASQGCVSAGLKPLSNASGLGRKDVISVFCVKN